MRPVHPPVLLHALLSLLAVGGFGPGAPPAQAQTPLPPSTIGPVQLSSQPEIEAGFHLLYELKFQEARSVFREWEQQHPGEALGPAAESACYLFQEFDRQGVLTSDFFLDNKKFLGGADGAPDPELRDGFNAAVAKAQELGHARLKLNPRDPDALFALTIAAGMLSDYTSMIERKELDALHLTREADNTAKELLAVAPDAADAYVALGVANFILGSLSPLKRFVIRFGGYHGDRALGMKQLELAAANGHYLKPFAKLMLALAALREKQNDLARTQLEQLVAEFPNNPKFAHELAKLTVTIGPAATLR
jgi:tetratricopeptide (TPR) repeat protein